MQFHLDGFRPGDPAVSPPAEQHTASQPRETLPEELDVLIVGCGPTGLTLAAFPDIRVRIVDQKAERLLVGQADGVADAPATRLRALCEFLDRSPDSPVRRYTPQGTDLAPGHDIFELRGIDRQGCMIIVRPDQCIAHVLPLDAHTVLARFFAGFMLPG